MFKSRTQLSLNVRAHGSVDVQLGRKELKASWRKRRRAVRLLETAGFVVRQGRFIDTAHTADEAELDRMIVVLRQAYRNVERGYWAEPVADELVWPKPVAAPLFASRPTLEIQWPETMPVAVAA